MRGLYRLIAAAIPLLAVPFAMGEIASSAHDFSAATWSDQSICKPCHTPHNAVETGITGRLWAHTLSSASYTYHGASASPTDLITRLDAKSSIGQSDMDGATRLCLSCHDGTVALDSFMGKSGVADGMGIGQGTGHGAVTANLGVDLSNDHPVGFKAVYKENIGSAGHFRYKPVAGAIAAGLRFANSPTVAAGFQQDGTTALTYTNWPSVSCVSCHDVHNGSLPGEPGLLRVTNTGSKLCLSCHNK